MIVETMLCFQDQARAGREGTCASRQPPHCRGAEVGCLPLAVFASSLCSLTSHLSKSRSLTWHLSKSRSLTSHLSKSRSLTSHLSKSRSMSVSLCTASSHPILEKKYLWRFLFLFPLWFRLVYTVFLCDDSTGYEAYSFTTDAFGVFNVRTNLGACRTYMRKGVRAQTNLHKSWLVGTEKTICCSLCLTRGSNQGGQRMRLTSP